MFFADSKHEAFYRTRITQVRSYDDYHKSLVYLLGLSEETRSHFDQIFDMETGCIKPQCLHDGWQTSGSLKITRLAFNLYTDRTVTDDDTVLYSVSDIFCCGYAPYFWQGIKLRYPEYCRKRMDFDDVLEKLPQGHKS